jgi:hypothetical protein
VLARAVDRDMGDVGVEVKYSVFDDIVMVLSRPREPVVSRLAADRDMGVAIWSLDAVCMIRV